MERLKHRRDFLRAAAGRKRVMPGFVLQARARSDTHDINAGPRVGYTASRRVGGAVQRNRARRRLREAVRLVLSARARPNMDYVLIARQGTLSRSWDDLVGDLASAADAIHRKFDRQPARPAGTS